MAVIFSTDFESYADGRQSLLDNGWTGPIVPTGGQRCEVVSGMAHGGSKSVMCGDDLHIDPFPDTLDTAQLIFRTIAPSGDSVSAEAWFHKPVGTLTGSQTPPGGTAHLYFYNDASGLSGVQYVNSGGLGAHNNVSLFLNGSLLATVANVLPDHTAEQWFSMTVQMHLSTVNTTNDGVNSDGCLTCRVDGAVVLALQNIPVWVSTAGWASGLNLAPDRFQCGGIAWMDDVELTDDAMICGSDPGDPDVPPPNTSDPCCGGHPDPTNPTGPNPGETPVFPPLQPWDRECATGGDVPTAADVTDAESWSL